MSITTKRKNAFKNLTNGIQSRYDILQVVLIGHDGIWTWALCAWLVFLQPGDTSKSMTLSQMSSLDGGSPSMSPSVSHQSLPAAALISSSSSRPRFHSQSSSQLTGLGNSKGTLRYAGQTALTNSNQPRNSL